MDPELKTMMTELLKLNQENNAILKKVYNKQKWAQISKAIYWFIIIGIGFGGFYFIQPYLGSVLNYYSAIGAAGGADNTKVDSGSSLPDVKHLQDLLKQVNGQ